MTMTGVPLVDEPVEHAEQPVDVGHVQAARRFVEDVGPSSLAHPDGELDPLALPARERRQRLAQPDVAEPDVDEPAKDRAWCAPGEELLRLGDGQVEHVRDVLPVEMVGQDRGLEAPALALLARARHPGHHRQVGVDDAQALAVRARAL